MLFYKLFRKVIKLFTVTKKFKKMNTKLCEYETSTQCGSLTLKEKDYVDFFSYLVRSAMWTSHSQNERLRKLFFLFSWAGFNELLLDIYFYL